MTATDVISRAAGSSLPATIGELADISDTFTYAWVYKKRLFFIQDNLNAYYLPVEIGFGCGGEAAARRRVQARRLAEIRQHVVAGCRRRPSGVLCFRHHRGRVRGFRRIGPERPERLGSCRHVSHRPADGKEGLVSGRWRLAIATDVGLVPLSAARTRDVAALAPASASWPIHSAWNELVNNRNTRDGIARSGRRGRWCWSACRAATTSRRKCRSQTPSPAPGAAAPIGTRPDRDFRRPRLYRLEAGQSISARGDRRRRRRALYRDLRVARRRAPRSRVRQECAPVPGGLARARAAE